MSSVGRGGHLRNDFIILWLVAECASSAGTLSVNYTEERPMVRMSIAALLATFLAWGLTSPAHAADCDEVIGRHMAGQAMLAAQFVAAAEKGGMTASQ